MRHHHIIREFKQRRFWATHVNRKSTFFSFNMPWRYQICIAKRQESVQNHGRGVRFQLTCVQRPTNSYLHRHVHCSSETPTAWMEAKQSGKPCCDTVCTFPPTHPFKKILATLWLARVILLPTPLSSTVTMRKFKSALLALFSVCQQMFYDSTCSVIPLW